MFSKFDPYKILGVATDASNEEIKKAYRELAKNTHPDKNGGDDKPFKELSRAYQILMDDNLREMYDRTGNVDGVGSHIDSAALQIMVNFFDAMAQELNPGVNPFTEDLITIGKNFVTEFIKNFERERKKTLRAQETLLKVEERISLKNINSNGLLKRALTHQANHLQHNLNRLDHQITAHKRALEMFDDYSFRADPKAAVSPWWQPPTRPF